MAIGDLIVSLYGVHFQKIVIESIDYHHEMQSIHHIWFLQIPFSLHGVSQELLGVWHPWELL